METISTQWVLSDPIPSHRGQIDPSRRTQVAVEIELPVHDN